MRNEVLLLLALAFVAAMSRLGTAQSPTPGSMGSMLYPSSVKYDEQLGANIVTYTFNVTLVFKAPSCFARPVVLVSDIFEPTITVNQGDFLKIVLINNIPISFPSVHEGINVHYHGLRMNGPAAWFDGTAFLTACPIAPGKNYTYQFQVTDPPGSYFFHDHNTGFKGDGLQGALLVYPPRADPAAGGNPVASPPLALPDLWDYHGEHTLFLSDWYHAATNSLLFQLNMPFDAAKVSNDSGAWSWIGNPQAVLVNGQGFYGDCQLYPGSGGGPIPPLCAPNAFTVSPGRSAQQPWASNNNPGCTHSQFQVEMGKTYRLRLINGASLVYMTVCFEGHNVTVVAVDGIPVVKIYTSCVDVNNGQRLDVLLTANQPPANYWITVAPQYRVGSPAGYAVLNYRGAPNSTFPVTPAPQPANITSWGLLANELIKMAPELLVPSTNPTVAMYRLPGQATLAPPKNVSKFVLINLSQPLLAANGQLRWALDNVASSITPPCKPLMQVLKKDARYLIRQAVNASMVNGTGAGPFVGQNTIGEGAKATVYLDGVSPVPIYPSVGLRAVELAGGTVLDVAVNNNPGNAFNGDYRPSGGARNSMEQHPFHLHGHRFWVLASGNGTYDPSRHADRLNTVNPSYRDTVTVPVGGWVYIRFVADNPGIWPFHCHILPHAFMGQQLYFVEDIANLAPHPATMPACPGACRYNFEPYNKAFLRAKWGMAGWELPPL